MSLTLARVIKAAELANSAMPVAAPSPEPASSDGPSSSALPTARVVPRPVVDAAARAKAILERAETERAELLERATREASELRLRAETEGRAEATASVAAKAIALREREARSVEAKLDQVVDLAKVLAERLLGRALEHEPALVIDLAKQVLKEARGARQITIAAHPLDLEILTRALATLSLDSASLRIEADPSRARGSLRLVTEIGILDAELAPQLERLALKLRESLRDER